jgi:hypothetical protein
MGIVKLISPSASCRPFRYRKDVNESRSNEPGEVLLSKLVKKVSFSEVTAAM